jgi:hypothetical protein
MAGGRQDIHDEQAGVTHGDGGIVRALPQGLCKQTLAEWKDATADYVRTKLFDKQQFVSDEDLVMGGHIQKLVSFELHISVLGGTGWDDNRQEYSSQKAAGSSECNETCVPR